MMEPSVTTRIAEQTRAEYSAIRAGESAFAAAEMVTTTLTMIPATKLRNSVGVSLSRMGYTHLKVGKTKGLALRMLISSSLAQRP